MGQPFHNLCAAPCGLGVATATTRASCATFLPPLGDLGLSPEVQCKLLGPRGFPGADGNDTKIECSILWAREKESLIGHRATGRGCQLDLGQAKPIGKRHRWGEAACSLTVSPQGKDRTRHLLREYSAVPLRAGPKVTIIPQRTNLRVGF